MLTLTRKQYEIEEKIQLTDENNNLLYEFMMKITPEEMDEVKNIIFNENDIKDGRKLSSLENNGNLQEYDEFEAKVISKAKERQEQFENICFKEHKETFKEKAGNYKYNEMVEMLFDFFVQTFVEKKSQQINIMSSHLRKISNK